MNIVNQFLLELHRSGVFLDKSSVIELGSKDVWDTPFGLDEFMRSLGKQMTYQLLVRHIENSRLSASILWEALGFCEYKCIDVDGAHDALNFDLNHIIFSQYDYTNTFDVVTNFGTSEHVFNQLTVFENIHNLCKVGGVMIHSLPSQKYISHGLYNYQPDFFHHLAIANKYTVVNVLLGTKKNLTYFSEKEYEDKSMAKEDLNIIVVLRKNEETNFKLPYQFDAAKKLIFDYEMIQKEFLKANLWSILSAFGFKPLMKVAIFGSAMAAKVAKEFCDFAEIEVLFFVDDFKDGDFMGKKVFLTKEFLAHKQGEVEVVLKGPFQKGSIGANREFLLQELELPQFVVN